MSISFIKPQYPSVHQQFRNKEAIVNVRKEGLDEKELCKLKNQIDIYQPTITEIWKSSFDK